jgi:hypothetical protein
VIRPQLLRISHDCSQGMLDFIRRTGHQLA